MTCAKHTLRAIAFAAMSVAAGCTPLSPNLDSHFGSALTSLKQQQTFDAAASARQDNPAQDGKAAAETTRRYVQSYSAPAPHPNVFTIGVSGGGR
jgi:hypothetical protein